MDISKGGVLTLTLCCRCLLHVDELAMGRYRRKRMHKNIKDIKKKYRTKRRTKDIDQIHEDLRPENAERLRSQAVDHDLPGLGQHYCLTCA